MACDQKREGSEFRALAPFRSFHLSPVGSVPSKPPGATHAEGGTCPNTSRFAGARENNLKNVSLRIPKRKITIFTGVSGSGKSSIVFDTVATEAQRQLFENFSMFVRNFLPRYPQPDADAIENLSMAVIVDQKRLGGGSHSTVGTITDIYTLLRLLFSRVGQPHIGYSNAFSFNDPQGMCPECNGIGRKLGVIADDFLDYSKSINDGGIQVPFFASWESKWYAASGFFDNDKKLGDFTPEELDLLLYSKPRKYPLKIGDATTMNATYMGIIEKIEKSYVRRDLKTLSERTQKAVAPYIRPQPCPLCKGARLSQATLSCRINGRNIAELSSMEIGDLIPVLREITDSVAAPMVDALVERLQHMADIGLEYLSLNRETDTLSGGESQRVKMVKHLGSSLVDVMYIFDEPSVGLHPRDVHRLNELLRKLCDKGNTVLVVEHDRDVIEGADHIVDVGPHAGTAGGEIVFEGSFQDLLKADTLTGTVSSAFTAHEDRRAGARGNASRAECARKQPEGRQRGYSRGRADSHHRRGGVGQELAYRGRVSAPASGSDCDRSISGRNHFTIKPSHVHRRDGRHPEGVRQCQ